MPRKKKRKWNINAHNKGKSQKTSEGTSATSSASKQSGSSQPNLQQKKIPTKPDSTKPNITQFNQQRSDSKSTRATKSKSTISSLEGLQKKLFTKKGHVYSFDSMRVVLLVLIFQFLARAQSDHTHPNWHPGSDRSDFVTASKQSGMSLSAIRALWKEFQETGGIPVTKKRGRSKNTLKKYTGHNLDPVHITKLCEWIPQMNQNGEVVTIKALKERFVEEFDISIPRQSLRYVMRKIGFVWGKVKKVGRFKLKVSKKLRIRKYLLEYSTALKMQESDEAIVVYMDETYCHQRHSSSYTWFDPNAPEGNKLVTGSGKGLRFIILHAITKDGLLWDDTTNEKEFYDDVSTLDDIHPNCEMIFIGPENSRDYHKNMEGGKFMMWVRNRLTPAFKRKYGADMKMFLVLDNAPYHHKRGKDYIDPSSMRRNELLKTLIDLAKVRSITIKREISKELVETEVELKNAGSRGGKRSPNVPELQTCLQEWLDRHPEHQQSDVKKYFDAQGWELIYTPPYTPQLQPIELIWASMKGHVARRFTLGRTMAQTREQIFEGFYGGEGRDGVSNTACEKCIKKCHEFAEQFIASDDALTGPLTDLLQNLDVQISVEEDNEITQELEHLEPSDIDETFFQMSGLVQQQIEDE